MARKITLSLSLAVFVMPSIAAAGVIVAWGRNQYGQIDDVPVGTDFVAMGGGFYHGLALRSDGSLVAWGNDSYGQVTGTPAGYDFVAFDAGYWHNVALKTDGSITVWGRDNYSQVSNAPSGVGFAAVAAGSFHCVAVRTDGSLVAWGRDDVGQVSNAPAGNNFVAVAAGESHSLALRDDGSIVGWGDDTFGQATGPAGNDFVAIAAFSNYNVALRSDGSLLAWGIDSNNLVTDAPTGNDFASLGPGGNHALALKDDGSIVGWGADSYGQVSNAPLGPIFAAVAGGGDFSIALTKPPGPIPQGDRLYFTETYNPSFSHGSIRCFGMEDEELQTVLVTGGGVRSVALNVAEEKLYWTDVNLDEIGRVNFDGTGFEILPVSFLRFAAGLAVDPAAGLLYWGDTTNGWLARSDLDGFGAATVLYTPFFAGLGLDRTDGLLYWTTSLTSGTGDILRCNVDGSNVETVVTGWGKPAEIALDGQGRVYWTDTISNRVYRTRLDGSDPEPEVLYESAHDPLAITIDRIGGKVYWGQEVSGGPPYVGKIMRMNLNGSDPEDVVVADNIGVVVEIVFLPEHVPGDFDADGDVDLKDFQTFAYCMNGPEVGYPEGCEAADFDGDADVDLADSADFQGFFTGG